LGNNEREKSRGDDLKRENERERKRDKREREKNKG